MPKSLAEQPQKLTFGYFKSIEFYHSISQYQYLGLELLGYSWKKKNKSTYEKK